MKKKIDFTDLMVKIVVYGCTYGLIALFALGCFFLFFKSPTAQGTADTTTNATYGAVDPTIHSPRGAVPFGSDQIIP